MPERVGAPASLMACGAQADLQSCDGGGRGGIFSGGSPFLSRGRWVQADEVGGPGARSPGEPRICREAGLQLGVSCLGAARALGLWTD